jgi:hypothetical protein
MPHFDDEPTLGTRKLLLIGIPSVIGAIVVSMLVQQFSDLLAHRLAAASASAGMPGNSFRRAMFETVVGPSVTLIAALISFAAFLRFPKNLFLGALAFVNAVVRLPETLTLFIRLFFRERTVIPPIQDGAVVAIAHNPTAEIVVLCFLSLTLLFVGVAIIHELTSVKWKWFVALAVYAALIPLQPLLLKIMAPLIA